MSNANDTITRADISEGVHRELGLSKVDSAEIVETIISEISLALKQEEIVKISSFARFQVRQKTERIGRNPRTKIEAVIPSRRVVSFRPSNMLKTSLNQALKKENF